MRLSTPAAELVHVAPAATEPHPSLVPLAVAVVALVVALVIGAALVAARALLAR